MKVFIKVIRSNFKELKAKDNHSARNKKYSQRKLFEYNESDEQSRFQQRFEIYKCSFLNVAMKEIFVNINSDSRTIKYKKIKLIKFSSLEAVEITKKFKKLI